ncbi:MAG: hypothetical protein PUF65_04355 [Lachnospiraceae bacterium]|nr:hypothetical protein [Lachnospiraceae bacterium]
MNIFENTVLVDRKVSVGNIIARYACIALAVLCVLVSIVAIPGLFLVPAILFAVIWYLLRTEAQTEWEYCYIEGRLTIARIKAKRKRKTIARIEMEEVVIIAPSDAQELRQYHSNAQFKVKNCTSGNVDAHPYEVIYKKEDGLKAVSFEPDENMLDMFCRNYAKRVVR